MPSLYSSFYDNDKKIFLITSLICFADNLPVLQDIVYHFQFIYSSLLILFIIQTYYKQIQFTVSILYIIILILSMSYLYLKATWEIILSNHNLYPIKQIILTYQLIFDIIQYLFITGILMYLYHLEIKLLLLPKTTKLFRTIQINFKQDETCVICFENLEYDIVETYCLHKYHTKCLLKWLMKNRSCPTCRANV